MNSALERILPRQGDAAGRLPTRRAPSWEIVVFALSVALPLVVFGGRLIMQRLDDRAALAAEEEQPRRKAASQADTSPAREDTPRSAPAATAQTAIPQSTIVDASAAPVSPNTSQPAAQTATPAPVAGPQGVPAGASEVARPELSTGVTAAPQRPDVSAPSRVSAARTAQRPATAAPTVRRQGVPSNAAAGRPAVSQTRTIAPSFQTQSSVASHAQRVPDHQHDEAAEFDEDGNVRPAMPADGRVSEPISPIQQGPVQSIAATLDLDLENALANAWGLIERGDQDLGRRVLLEARRTNKTDIRTDFSLGLLDALLDHNWQSAEKHFAECVRREPQNVASLNNLAIVRLRLTWDRNALRPWEMILADATPVEVLQNLGRVRFVLQGGRLPGNPALAEAVDQLYLKTSIATGTSAQPRTGFLFMGLTLDDGRTVGWSDAKKYEDTWCTVCQGSGQMRCPNPACVRGMVKLPKLQGGGRAACNTCRGSGKATCNACSRGRDRSLAYYPSAPVRGSVTPATTPAPSPAAPSPAAASPAVAAPPVAPQRGPLVQPAPLAPGLQR